MLAGAICRPPLLALSLLAVTFSPVTIAADQMAAQNAATVKRYVRIAPAVAATTPPPLPFSGTVKAGDNAPLAFQISGRLFSRPAQVGQTVSKGDLLAVLDNPQLKPAYQAAQARVTELSSRAAQSDRDLQRVEKLLGSQSATVEEVEKVKANHDALRAALALAKAERARARQLLAETHLRAPFAGQVSSVLSKPGQFIAPGQTVVALSGADGLEVEVGVPARLLPLLQQGLAVPLSQFGQRLAVTGSISRIAHTSNAGQLNRVVVALSTTPQTRLQAGDTVSVLLPSAKPAKLLAVPVRAVIDTGRGVPRVFKFNTGKVTSTQVELHRVLGQTVLISGPLQAGDQVVYAGLAGLQDGATVEVLP